MPCAQNRSRAVVAPLLLTLIALPAVAAALDPPPPPPPQAQREDAAHRDSASDDAQLRAALDDARLSLAKAVRRAERHVRGRAIEARYHPHPDGLRIHIVVLTEDRRTRVVFDAVSGERVEQPRAPGEDDAPATPTAAQEIRDRTGLRFSVLESRIRRRMIRTRTPYGLKISSIDRGSPGALAGLQPGDVLLEIDGRPIDTLERLRERLRAGAPGEAVPIHYARLRPERTIFTRHPWQEHDATLTPRP
ncbi:MAG: PepSY domain-containing protein [Planctomycetota bacterium]